VDFKVRDKRFASDNPADYYQCPKCGIQTSETSKGVVCDVCGPIEDLILASKENFDEVAAPRKAQAASKASARVAAAKG